MLGEEGTRRATILFVHDEPDMSALIEQVFEEQVAQGYYKILFATDGVDALEKLRGNPDIDVVLSDIRIFQSRAS